MTSDNEEWINNHPNEINVLYFEKFIKPQPRLTFNLCNGSYLRKIELKTKNFIIDYVLSVP